MTFSRYFILFVSVPISLEVNLPSKSLGGLFAHNNYYLADMYITAQVSDHECCIVTSPMPTNLHSVN